MWVEGAAVNNQWFSKVAVWLVVALVLFTVFKQFDRAGAVGGQMAYSEFLEEVRAKRIKNVTLQEGGGGTEIIATTTDDGSMLVCWRPSSEASLLGRREVKALNKDRIP